MDCIHDVHMYSFVLNTKATERQTEERKKECKRIVKVNTKRKCMHVNDEYFPVTVMIKFIDKFKRTKKHFRYV